MQEEQVNWLVEHGFLESKVHDGFDMLQVTDNGVVLGTWLLSIGDRASILRSCEYLCQKISSDHIDRHEEIAEFIAEWEDKVG